MTTTLRVVEASGAAREFRRHPIEEARQALIAAAELEGERWAPVLRRFASALPERGPLYRPAAGGIVQHTPEQEERWEAQREAQRAWTRLSPAARESLLLDVLGDDRLIIRELTSRLNAKLGYPDDEELGLRWQAVYPDSVRSLVMRMLRAGQLARVPETFNVNHVRYRYFRGR